ncbi:MAG: ABC-2 family transporter protein [Lachnospiraceae bacterium]|nr:ABC-2 family transporter protein [Lachnospiraceae bacterium]
MGKFIEIFWWNCKLNMAKSMAYRLDFCIGLCVNLLIACAGPIFQYLLFSQVNGYPGWTMQEIIFFQGMLLVILGLRNLLFGNVAGYVQNLIFDGSLDQLLLRPYSSIGMILANGFSLDGIGTVAAGTVISIVAMMRMHLIPPWYLWIITALSVVVSLLLFMSFDIFLASVMIRLVRIGRLNEMFDTIAKFGQYPLEVYPKGMRLLFSTFVPFAVWINIPCKIFLHGLQAYMMVPVVCVVLILLLALQGWNRCMKHYTSAGG